MERATIDAIKRTTSGTKIARRLRKSGQLPAIIYGHGEPPQSISLPTRDVCNELHHGSHLLRLRIDGTEEQFFIKEVQYDYLGTNPMHLDLTRVNLDEKVKVTVAIELKGVPVGVKEGGVLDQLLGDLEVECVVTQIPEILRPNVTQLGLSESLHVKEIEYPEGVVPVTPGDEVVCTVRALVEPGEDEEEAEGEGGTAEPELIRKPKEEEASGS